MSQQQQQSVPSKLSSTSVSPPPAKKGRFAPAPISVPPTSASDLTVLHQSIALSFLYNNNINNTNKRPLSSTRTVLPSTSTPSTRKNTTGSAPAPCWYAQGTTTLYVIAPTSSSSSSNKTIPVALHLRRTCHVESILVEAPAVVPSATTATSSRTYHNTGPSIMTLVPLPTSAIHHVDPLAHVLIKPPTTYSQRDLKSTNHASNATARYGADAQCSRGATGFMTGLRAASIASHMGELRFTVLNTTTTAAAATPGPSSTSGNSTKTNQPPDATTASNVFDCWMTDLKQNTTTITNKNNNNNHDVDGTVVKELEEVLHERSITRDERLALIATHLSKTTTTKKSSGGGGGGTALKITIRYTIDLSSPHLGGMHSSSATNSSSTTTTTTTTRTPLLYTTCGTVGDHEGPRSWVPCVDHLSQSCRTSRCMTIQITSPMRHGLSVVGCGDDYGISKTYLHDEIKSRTTTKTKNQNDDNADDDSMSSTTAIATATVLGKRHVEWLKEVYSVAHQQQDTTLSASSTTNTIPHIIPPDDDDDDQNVKNHATIGNSMDSIHATTTWCGQSWSPSPARSMGFAIGPFRVLEDPEYFSIDTTNDSDDGVGNDEMDEDDDDDDDDDDYGTNNKKKKELESLELARQRGEGIRNVYCAPLFYRKFIHATTADMSLLPTTHIGLQPLTQSQREELNTLDITVLSGTSGVPHRALSLLRDTLAVPWYRTTSYTQIWIPDAVHGGTTSGALHTCPEVLCNPFLGGAILDSRLLPPPNCRLAYHTGGRVLQFLQARCALRGWITAALPLGGGNDSVGNGYILTLLESFCMSLYERGHGAHGEGGSKESVFFIKRFSINSGLNSSNLDFLPVANMEDGDHFEGLGGPVPTDDRNNEQLWRNASNGTESHTSALDEYNIRQVLVSDIVETLERGADLKDKNVPLPSTGWTGSHLSLSFLSSTASSSSELGCGAVELAHPIGGLLYRTVKSDVFRRITEGRATTANFVRAIRAAFVAAHLGDLGETKLKWDEKQSKGSNSGGSSSDKKKSDSSSSSKSKRPAFVTCVDNLLSKGGLSHTVFVGCLRLLAGERAAITLAGSQVDIARNVISIATKKPFVDPEGYPNSYVRGASLPYLRVGTHVEATGTDAAVSGPAGMKGTQLFVVVEPCIPDGGIAYSGTIMLRVVENEGQVREFRKELMNGARADWGPIFLHAKPVATAKEQLAASGVVEAPSAASTTTTKSKKQKNGEADENEKVGSVLDTLPLPTGGSAFNVHLLHSEGFQAIELVRLTNRTPLLWVRVDPQCFFGARMSIFQPVACLAEMLFHDGDSAAQVEAIRSLGERPLRIENPPKVAAIHNVQVSELPVRLLGDCLRGSPALHGDLPHTPAVRVQAALGIAQWQNNKAPKSELAAEGDWYGVNLLLQYFKERYYKNGIIMPVKFTRIAVKKSDEGDAGQPTDAAGKKAKGRDSDEYVYIDTLRDVVEKHMMVSEAELVEAEEDEEYRVRSAVISAIAAIRAENGKTPPQVLRFLSTVLEAGDVSMVGAFDNQEAEAVGRRKATHQVDEDDQDKDIDIQNSETAKLQFIPSAIIADALLAVCSVNTALKVIADPTTGKPIIQAQAQHPIEKLLVASRRWLEWELYRETIRSELDRDSQSGVGGNCYDSVAACGVAAVSTLAILRQATTDQAVVNDEDETKNAIVRAQFYKKIMDEEPRRPDVTRAACAQAVACVCCAADRFESPEPAFGLLTALEYLLLKIIDPLNSPGLRQTLALLMLDTCTGKVSSMQRVAVIGGRSDLYHSGARFYGGPLGASNGSDNGSALLMNVNPATNPAASAVNEGARRGLKLLTRAGHPKDESKDEIIVRVAKFATDLWRTINGHRLPLSETDPVDVNAAGVCANDGILRCSLLSLWQLVWPKACYSIMRVQSWRPHEHTPRYKALNADIVLQVYDEETEAATEEELAFNALNQAVNSEIDRQAWRGEMTTAAYEATMVKSKKDADSGLGDILPPIERLPDFKSGGWVAATARQRRMMQLDGGQQVKLRVSVSKASD